MLSEAVFLIGHRHDCLVKTFALKLHYFGFNQLNIIMAKRKSLKISYKYIILGMLFKAKNRCNSNCLLFSL